MNNTNASDFVRGVSFLEKTLKLPTMKWLILLLFLPSAVLAQGFAGLGTDASGFATPQRGQILTFPRDHGPHPDYRIEWWYLTANLQDADGQDYGLQWTLFRSSLRPQDAEGWDSSQIWMGRKRLPTQSYSAHQLGQRCYWTLSRLLSLRADSTYHNLLVIMAPTFPPSSIAGGYESNPPKIPIVTLV